MWQSPRGWPRWCSRAVSSFPSPYTQRSSFVHLRPLAIAHSFNPLSGWGTASWWPGSGTTTELLPFLCFLFSFTWSLRNHWDSIFTTWGCQKLGCDSPPPLILSSTYAVVFYHPLQKSPEQKNVGAGFCLSTSSIFWGHCEAPLTALSPVSPCPLWWSSV